MRALWTAGWLLAVAGPVVHVLAPGTATWWVGAVAVLPLVGLAIRRADRTGSDTSGVDLSGPFGPP